MKKIIYFISMLALIFLTGSCNNEKEGTLFDFGGKDFAAFETDNYVFEANKEGKNVVYLYHLSDGESSTFPLSVDYNGAENLFSISPTQISFDKNVNRATIEISYDITKLELFKPNTIILSVPEQNYPGINLIEKLEVIIVFQPEWEHFADGVFESGFFKDSWPQEIMKAKGLDIYKLPSLYEDGADFIFKLENEATGEISIPGITPNGDGTYRWNTGYIDDDYKMIWGTLKPDAARTWFDEASKNAVFSFNFNVLEGTFGCFKEMLTW